MTPQQTVLVQRGKRAIHWWRALFTTESVLFTCTFAFYTLLAAGAVHYYNLEMGDALARTANAAYVVLSRDPHYGAIGTVWPPLTSTLQIPLVWLLVHVGAPAQFAGNLVSALATAGTLVVLYRLFGALALSDRWRWTLLLLYAGNPLVLFYAINGMSEALFIFWIVFALYGVVRWWQTQHAGSLGISGVAMSGAFLTRYEAIALAGVMALTFAYDVRRRGDDHPFVRITLFVTPVLYTILFWLGFNFITMKSPLYFLKSPYADFTNLNPLVSTEQRGLIAQLSSSLVATVGYSGVRSLVVFLPALPLAIVSAWQGWRRRATDEENGISLLLVLPVLAFSIVAFDTLLLFLGVFPTGIRFYLHLIPFAIVVFAVLAARLPAVYARPRWAVALVAGTLLTGVIMAQPALAPQEATFLRAMRTGQPMQRFAEEDAVGRYLRQETPANARILIDTRYGFPIILDDPNLRRFVIPSDLDYDEIVANPVGEVDYVLVQDPRGYGWSDPVNRQHPTLYRDRWPYAVLVYDFEGEAGWRLFRVTGGDDDG